VTGGAFDDDAADGHPGSAAFRDGGEFSVEEVDPRCVRVVDEHRSAAATKDNAAVSIGKSSATLRASSE